ncbi:hypothetical protein [Burkholderia contaminans]|uniref:hypothetical protein n=1 Tax=Burkholderia contaminans TaxID=488447 RepID=UPI00158ADF44|nr:hypothetical protein [Burkholderia contaminans]
MQPAEGSLTHIYRKCHETVRMYDLVGTVVLYIDYAIRERRSRLPRISSANPESFPKRVGIAAPYQYRPSERR